MCCWADSNFANTAQYLEDFYFKGTFELVFAFRSFPAEWFPSQAEPSLSGPWADFKRFRTLPWNNTSQHVSPGCCSQFEWKPCFATCPLLSPV